MSKGTGADERKSYNSIDLTKFIMSIAVVALHTEPLKNCSNIWIARLYLSFANMAVPFFFLAFGFLLAQKMSYPFLDQNSRICLKSEVVRFVRYYVQWTVIYFPLAVYYYYDTGVGIKKAFLDFLRGFFFRGEHYNSWHLWYLLATIYALIFIQLLQNLLLKPETITLVGGVVFCIGVGISFLTSHNDSLPKLLNMIQIIFKYTIATGRILSGCLYIPLGMLLSVKMISPKKALGLFCCGYILNCCVDNQEVSTILIAVSAVGFFGLIVRRNLSDSLRYPFMRKLSTIIFFIHMYVWTAYYTVIYHHRETGVDCFVVTSAISILIAAFYVKAKNRKLKSKSFNGGKT